MTGQQFYTAIVIGGLGSLALQLLIAVAWAALKERRARR
jgi:hypothetical protein